MSRAGSLVATAFLVSASLCACTTPGPVARCDLEGLDWNRLRASTPPRVQVRLVSEDGDRLLDVVARGNGPGLGGVGLTHYGVRLFAVRQEGEVIHTEGVSGGEPLVVASQVLDALLRASGSDVSKRVDEKEGISIRYSGTGPGTRFEIHQPRCGYDANLVEVSGTLSVEKSVSPEGVEP